MMWDIACGVILANFILSVARILFVITMAATRPPQPK
jgi:hypothetical protein